MGCSVNPFHPSLRLSSPLLLLLLLLIFGLGKQEGGRPGLRCGVAPRGVGPGAAGSRRALSPWPCRARALRNGGKPDG